MSKPVILLDAGQLVGLSGAASGEVLTWDGTAWISSPVDAGTVTSVALDAAATGLTVSGSTSQTITDSGTFTLGGTLGAGYGGTGLGAPVSGDAGKVLAATAGGGYELVANGNGTVTSVTAGAGLSGGTITTSGTISMPNVGTTGAYGSASSVPVITTDAQGRVTGVVPTAIAIAQSAVTDLVTDLAGKVPTTTQVIAGTGLSGGGALSSNVTVSLPNVGAQGVYGSASSVAVVTTDAQGRVSGATTTAIAITQSQVADLVTDLAAKVDKTITVSAGTGLTGGGALSADRTLSLDTVGTAASNQGSASKTVTLSTDAYGRVTSLYEQDISNLPASAITSGVLALEQGGTGINAESVTAGQLLVGGSGSLALQSVSQDAALASDGKLTVTGLQTNPVSATVLGAPDAGKALVWSGTEWQASTIQGGGGGGGLTFYMNYAASSPFPMSTVFDENAGWDTGAITVAGDANGTALGTFVTAVGAPAIEVIPAGLWDVNFYAQASNNANTTAVRIKVATLAGATQTVIATSDWVYISDPSAVVGYSASVYVPLTDVSLTDRVEIIFEGRRYGAAARTITLHFGTDSITHAHTTISAPGGTGLLKVVDGYLQSPASLLVNADVDAAAAIAVSKLAAGTNTYVLTTVAGVPTWSPSAAGGVSSILGVADQVLVSNPTGTVTLSLPQSIGTGSSPAFAGLTLGSFSGLLRATGGVLAGGASVSLTSEVSGTLPLANGGTNLTSSGASGNLLVSDGSAWASVPMSGDATIASTGALTLKNTGSAGTYGSASAVPVFATDAQGRVTSVTNTSIAINVSQINAGTLTVLRGGTGRNTLSAGHILVGAANSAVSLLAGTSVNDLVQWTGTAWARSDGQALGTSASPTFAAVNTSSVVSTGSLQLDVGTGNIFLTSAAATQSIAPDVASVGKNLRINAGSAEGEGNKGGTLTLAGGPTSTATNVSGGDVVLRASAGRGSGTSGTVTIGATSTSAVFIGAATIPTTISGNLYANSIKTSFIDSGTSGPVTIGLSNTSAVSIGASSITTTVYGTLSANSLTTSFITGVGSLLNIAAGSGFSTLYLQTPDATTAQNLWIRPGTNTAGATGSYVTVQGGSNATAGGNAIIEGGRSTLDANNGAVFIGSTFTKRILIGGSPNLTTFELVGSPTTTTQPTSDDSTNIATTAFVKAQGYAPLASPTFTGTVTIPAGASISGYAPLASPTFTGTVAIPTLTLTNALGATSGGTGQSTYATGDLLYASATNTLSKRAAGTNGQVLTMSGGVPTWSSASSGGVTSITGTANQVIASASTGAITLSLPQSISTSSSPSFATLTATTAVVTDVLKNRTGSSIYIGDGTSSNPVIMEAGYRVGYGRSIVIRGGVPTGTSLSGGDAIFRGGDALSGGTGNGGNTFITGGGQSGGTGLSGIVYIGTVDTSEIVVGVSSMTTTLNGTLSLPNKLALSNLATGTNGQVLTMVSGVPTWSSASSGGVTSITGTANQVIASASTGAITLSLPQSIGTSSTPSFAEVTASTQFNAVKLYASTAAQIALDSGFARDFIFKGAGTAGRHVTLAAGDRATSELPEDEGGALILCGGDTANTIGKGGNIVLSPGKNTTPGAKGGQIWLGFGIPGDKPSNQATLILIGGEYTGADKTTTIVITGDTTIDGKLTLSGTKLDVGNIAPSATNGYVLTTFAGSTQWRPASGGGGGTVTGVTLDAGSTGLTISAGFSQTITTSGTFLLGGTLGAGYGGTGVSTTAESYVFAGPASGSGTPSFRQLAAADITGISGTYAPLASPTFTGTVTLPLTTAGYVKTTSGGVISSSATVSTGDLSGQVSLASGGTNASLTASNGQVAYSTATELALTSGGTTGQVLKFNSGSAPTWGDVTVPAQPYDLRGRFVGTPASSVILDAFIADRAATISTTNTAHKFSAKTIPSAGSVVLTVQRTRAGSTVTIFTATSASTDSALNGYYPMTISSVTNNDILTDDVVEVVMQSGAVNASFSTPVWTIFATA